MSASSSEAKGPSSWAIERIVIHTTNPEKSLHFYSSLFEFTPENEQQWRSKQAPFPSVRVSPSLVLDLVPSKEQGASGSGVRKLSFCTTGEKLLRLHSLIREAGIHIEEGPARNGEGVSLSVQDPSGVLVEATTYETQYVEELLVVTEAATKVFSASYNQSTETLHLIGNVPSFVAGLLKYYCDQKRKTEDVKVQLLKSKAEASFLGGSEYLLKCGETDYFRIHIALSRAALREGWQAFDGQNYGGSSGVSCRFTSWMKEPSTTLTN
ncbi:Dioxygenase [Balamuthia mandrillaris]